MPRPRPPTDAGLPQFVKDEFDASLEYGSILAHGFLWLRANASDRNGIWEEQAATAHIEFSEAR